MESTTLLLIVLGVVAVVAAIVVLRRRSDVVSVAPAAPAAPSGDLEQEARALLAQGNAIAAIKLVRERTGWGLKPAKEYVDALRAGAPLPVAAPAESPAPAQEFEQEARALLAQGNAIAAIKLVRERTGWGLKQAKEYVDALR